MKVIPSAVVVAAGADGARSSVMMMLAGAGRALADRLTRLAGPQDRIVAAWRALDIRLDAYAALRAYPHPAETAIRPSRTRAHRYGLYDVVRRSGGRALDILIAADERAARLRSRDREPNTDSRYQRMTDWADRWTDRQMSLLTRVYLRRCAARLYGALQRGCLTRVIDAMVALGAAEDAESGRYRDRPASAGEKARLYLGLLRPSASRRFRPPRVTSGPPKRKGWRARQRQGPDTDILAIRRGIVSVSRAAEAAHCAEIWRSLVSAIVLADDTETPVSVATIAAYATRLATRPGFPWDRAATLLEAAIDGDAVGALRDVGQGRRKGSLPPEPAAWALPAPADRAIDVKVADALRAAAGVSRCGMVGAPGWRPVVSDGRIYWTRAGYNGRMDLEAPTPALRFVQAMSTAETADRRIERSLSLAGTGPAANDDDD